LTDEEMAIVLALAAPIERARRDAFLQQVVAMLACEPERGQGVAHRIGREVQAQFFVAPRMSYPGAADAYSRSPKLGFAHRFPRA
jgi:hypothetical protein